MIKQVTTRDVAIFAVMAMISVIAFFAGTQFSTRDLPAIGSDSQVFGLTVAEGSSPKASSVFSDESARQYREAMDNVGQGAGFAASSDNASTGAQALESLTGDDTALYREALNNLGKDTAEAVNVPALAAAAAGETSTAQYRQAMDNVSYGAGFAQQVTDSSAGVPQFESLVSNNTLLYRTAMDATGTGAGW